MASEALCVMEKYFPPSFFDIRINLVVHLADEVLVCGPVRYRWMYLFERAMKSCKNLPSNKRYVEGTIEQTHLTSESASRMESSRSGSDLLVQLRRHPSKRYPTNQKSRRCISVSILLARS